MHNDPPGTIAARKWNLYSNPPSVDREYTFQFAPPYTGATLVDSTDSDFPYYPGTEVISDLGTSISIGDGPSVNFHTIHADGSVETILPLFSAGQSLEINMTHYFKDYLVWQYSDKSAYPLANTQWNIHWAGTIFPLILGLGGPSPSFVWVWAREFTE